MARDGAVESDLDVGLAMVLGPLAIGGALVSFLFPGTLAGAGGFAAAMLFGTLLVVALHVYG